MSAQVEQPERRRKNVLGDQRPVVLPKEISDMFRSETFKG